MMHASKFGIEDLQRLENPNARFYGTVGRVNEDKGLVLVFFKAEGEIYSFCIHDADLIKEHKLVIGNGISFVMEVDNGDIRPADIHVKERYFSEKLRIADHEVPMKEVLRFGFGNAMKDLCDRVTSEEELHNHGYEKWMFNYLYLVTRKEDFKFFLWDSPILGDGQVNSFENIIEKINSAINTSVEADAWAY